MTKKNLYLIAIMIMIGWGYTITTAADISKSTRITLKADMIHDKVIAFYGTNYITKADRLVDQQDIIPDSPKTLPTQAAGGKNWEPSKKKEYNPVSAYIDLGKTYTITHIGYYDANGKQKIQFFGGEPFKRQKILEVDLTMYNKWITNTINPITTRFIRIISPANGDSGIKEIALYGYISDTQNDKSINTVETTKKPQTPADKAIGVNGFIDDPVDILKVAGHVREYHNRSRGSHEGDTKQMFNPSAAWVGWNFDKYYQSLYDQGIDVIPCIKGNTNRILGNNQKFENANEKPIKVGANGEDPASYTYHASHMFQYAARYGSTKIAESKLKLASGQAKKSGLGLVSYYENWNEPNNTWTVRNAYFSPYEFAAMTSADYDGHEKKLGADRGIKNADINAKLVMGGLAGAENAPYYLDLMKFRFTHNRKDQKFVPDVINIHQYSDNKAPEKSGFKKKLEKVITRRDQNEPNKEVWLTEFGWDTQKTSKIGTPNEETQGSRLMRGYLAAFAAGIDRISMYMIRDVESRNPSIYLSSGLVGEKGNRKQKISRYFIYTMKETLKNMIFDKVISEDNNAYVYKFSSIDGSDKSVYAIWIPADGDKVLKNYTFDIGTQKQAVLVTPTNGRIDGIKIPLSINNGKITIEISQKPVFVIVSNNTNTTNTTDSIISQNINKITIKEISTDIKAAKIGFNNLIDEQDQVPDQPYSTTQGTFTTDFGQSINNKLFPIDGYIDLGKKYHISHIGFYDTFGTGNIFIYQGSPENWDEQHKFTYDLSKFKKWVIKDTNLETRYLKIRKTNNTNLNEIGLYGYPIE